MRCIIESPINKQSIIHCQFWRHTSTPPVLLVREKDKIYKRERKRERADSTFTIAILPWTQLIHMSLSTGIGSHVKSLIKINWLLIAAAILFVCCSSIASKPTEVETLYDQALLDSYDPIFLLEEESSLAERAAPRLGRASPRLGRASPRLGRAAPRFGRRAASLILTHLNNAGRYHSGDDEIFNDLGHDIDSWMYERRAAPRLGRSIKVNEEQKKA